MTASAQIQGFTIANIMEVETNTKAGRVTLRPEDYGTLGAYSLGASSAIMAAGLANDAPILSARWTHASNLCLVKRLIISAGCDTVSFGAAVGAFYFNLFVARSFTVSDTGGASILPTGSMNKLRTTGMGTTLFGDIRMSQTAALTAGTRTLDGQALGSVVGSVIAGAGAAMLAPFQIFEAIPGAQPLVLAQNEGIVMQARIPGTGTWKFSIRLDWTELSAY